MKKAILSTLLLSCALIGNAQADNHSVSIGYAQSKVQDFKNIRGVNLQYRYEFDAPVSLLGSFSYMKGDKSQKDHFYGHTIKDQVDTEYYSVLIGPAYRVNDYVSLYALGGMAHVKADGKSSWIWPNGVLATEASVFKSSTSFAYGAGVIINPIKNVSINVGYEGTKADLAGGDYSINGFNIGVGYRF